MRLAPIAFIFLFCACATIGPQVASEEERRVQAILQAEAQAWQQQQNAARHAWQRAYTACLEGKGYTVN